MMTNHSFESSRRLLLFDLLEQSYEIWQTSENLYS